MLKSTLKGPTSHSYWVVPGKFLAGSHPVTSLYEESALFTLRPILQSRVTVFIDLTEIEEVTYRQLLLKEAANLGLNITYYHLPIEDMEIPTPTQMIKILDTIDAAIEAGQIVYIHCLAGLGRTGTVVGCYLVRHGISGDTALKEIRKLRQGMPFTNIKSPATEEQRAMVRDWPIGK